MSDEQHPFVSEQETLEPERVSQLLQRQRELQNESQIVVKELNLLELLGAGGVVRWVGSSILGLMVWRDIDLAVSSPGLSIARAYELMQPIYTHPRVRWIRYFNESGSFNSTGLQQYERYYFAVLYENDAGNEWKMDISFWLMQGIHPEPVHEAIEQQLTPETRLAILWIKDAWHQHPAQPHEVSPAYRDGVYSPDIYAAVLQHGVRTPGEFERYLAQRGKPAHGS